MLWFPPGADVVVCISEVMLAAGAVAFLGLALLAWVLREPAAPSQE